MENEMTSKYKILNRDVIKYLAMLTMLLNHISTIFMQSGDLLAEIFLDLGYFTAITMCYFLVEGFEYTAFKRKICHEIVRFCFAFPNTIFIGIYAKRNFKI